MMTIAEALQNAADAERAAEYRAAIRNAIEACRKLAEFALDADITACAGDTAEDLKYFAEIYEHSRDAAEGTTE